MTLARRMLLLLEPKKEDPMDRAIFDDVRTGAETARERAADLAVQASKAIGYLRALPLEQLLWRIGLERRRSRLYGIGLFGAGLACGAVAGALLSPKSGKELRATLNRSIKAAWGRGVETTKHYEESGERLWQKVRHHDAGAVAKGNQPDDAVS
jgi:hypothetical protein